MSEFRQTTLSNGLRIVAEISPRSYSAAFGYFVAAGARDETDAEAGVSHFLEHMMFKGTAKRSAADVNRELDELGGHSNAYTSEEHTVYHATVLPKFQDRIVELLTDMLSPALDAKEFETERQVILEEIAKYEDQPPFGAFERAMELHFSPRGLGRRILGTEASIRGMTVGRMRDYFHRKYRPENIVLAASGNVDFDALVGEVESLTGEWTSRPVPAAPAPDEADRLPEGVTLERRLSIADAAQAYHIQVVPGPAMTSADRFAVRLLASILGEEGGSRLFWELIDTGRAEVASLWSQEFSDTGVLFSYLVCGPEELESNRDLMNELLARAAEVGATREELEQAINRTVAGYIMQSERPGNRLFGIGTRWLSQGEYLSLDELLDRYRSVGLADIAAAAGKYLRVAATEVVAMSTDENLVPR